MTVKELIQVLKDFKQDENEVIINLGGDNSSPLSSISFAYSDYPPKLSLNAECYDDDS